ncbi:MAG: M1 family aminopeptidase [Ferruginibacter sp.]
MKAQEMDPYYHHRQFMPVANREIEGASSTGNSGTGANINVVYQRLQCNSNPLTGRNISGTVTTHFKTIAANVASISLDLNNSSFNNASLQVNYHGTSCTKSFSGNILTISLPVTIPAVNTLDSVVIIYAGIPPAVSGAAQGYQRGSYTDINGITQFYTSSLSESYEDRDWWPCKADMQDKIDSMDIEVTVPWVGADTFWVAANGKLVDSAIQGNERIFKYKTRYPIASYLVCLSVAKFNRYYSSVNVNGTQVPVHYYLLAGKTASYYTNAITAMDKVNAVVQAFSSKFGDYPFKLEKHGFYDGLMGASGMEHQTFSAMAPGALTSVSTLVHELMHQWFGDNVTFATWNDLWLAEGFARYSESLAGELVPSLGFNVLSQRNNLKNSALGQSSSAWIPNSNTGTSNLIWNSAYGSTVYQRGGMIVSMLRAIAGDAKFYQALTNYQNSYKGTAVSSDSLKKQFNAVLGRDIAEFFNDYLGGSGSRTQAVGGIGNPVNEVIWNAASNILFLKQGTQSVSAGSNVTYFNGPVAVRASNGVRDTSIIYYDWGGGDLSYAGNGLSDTVKGNLLSYRLSFTPTSLVYDDSARTLSTGTTTPDPSIDGYIWYGTVDNNWYNPANWSACCGVPPVKGADIVIASTFAEPVLSSAISVRNITINAGKTLNIAANELSITGGIYGTGTFTGSASSKLVIAGPAGDINFNQAALPSRTLSKLTLEAGSRANIKSNLHANMVEVKTGASLTVASGYRLSTN